MNTNLESLNNYLFEQLERLNDDETLNSDKNFDRELKRSKAIATIAKNIIDNANVVLEAEKFKVDNRLSDNIPKMLSTKNNK